MSLIFWRTARSAISFTGALLDETVDDYIALHRKALHLGIPCLTSLDTANALADIIASRYNQSNTELVNLNDMRTERRKLYFSKLHATGDDYIFLENFDGQITCPESLCISLCNRHKGIGGFGIVLIEHSDLADARMRVFNRDGSEGKMAGNCIRSLGKYLYDNGLVKKEHLTIETASGIHGLTLYTRDGKVTLVTVEMGQPDLNAASLPTTLTAESLINYPAQIGGKTYNITCLSVGNPHCVVFVDHVDALDLEAIGPQFEHAPIFPMRINTEFVRVVNPTTIKMRVYERGTGETWACGTGACAAVVAAVENGYCARDTDITVKVRGGDLTVRYTDQGLLLTGDTVLVYQGVTEY